MEASSLRIGNYIKLSQEARTLLKEDQQGFIEVRDINSSYINAWSDMGASGGISNPEPIPLTEQWLLKFGFENYKGKWFRLYYSNERYLLFGLNNCHIEMCLGDKTTAQAPVKHVHQLQNLYFALVGEELEIKQHELN